MRQAEAWPELTAAWAAVLCGPRSGGCRASAWALVGVKDSLHLEPGAIHVVPGCKDSAQLVGLDTLLADHCLQLCNGLQETANA